MPHPFASIALSLAPIAADMVGKIMNMKKDGKTKNDLQMRIEKLESYEVEQAQLIKKLVNKIEYLQKQQRRLKRVAVASIVIGVIALASALSLFILNLP